MKRTVVGVLIAVLLLIGGPARADSKPCNLKAIHRTAVHLANAKHAVRIARLQARYDRMLSRCSMPEPHS